jgi:hypothetical protein
VAASFPERILTLASFAATPGMKKGKQDYSSWVARIGDKGVAAFLRETIATASTSMQRNPFCRLVHKRIGTRAGRSAGALRTLDGRVDLSSSWPR